MQEHIRGMTEESFPDVQLFRTLHREGALRSADEAARDLWATLDRGLENGAVVDLRGA